MKNPKVWFLFNRPRAQRARMTRAGQWPGDGLYGYYDLRDFGFETSFSDGGQKPGPLKSGFKLLEDVLSKKGKRVGFNLAQAIRLRKELNRADLVFATADSSALGYLFLKSLGIVDRPVVYATIGLAEGFERKNGATFRFYKKLLGYADKIIYYGYKEGQILEDRFGIDRARLAFIPFGVDTEFFRGAQKRNAPPLAVGIDHCRDWALLFNVAGRLDFEIELICNPDQIVDLTIPENVRVISQVSMIELKDKMQSARFVLLPVVQNSYTGATITLLQSMACGCATIVSRTGAIENGYNLSCGDNCLLVQPGDADDLYEAADRLYNAQDLCEKMGEKAVKTIEEHHNIQNFSKDVSAIFDEVLKR